MCRWLAAIFLCSVQLVMAQDRTLRTGARFRAQLQEPLVARWENVQLRTVLERLRDDGDVSILLDRRIDPSQTPLVEFTNVSLKDGLPSAAAGFHAGISLPDNVIYLGPPSTCRSLRTLIALRTAELSQEEFQFSNEQKQQWLKPRTIRWDDLDSPREILARLETEIGFRIRNPELVEHDLRAAATLPEVTGIAALSLVLVQFDLTFAWRQTGEPIELVPMPDTVVIEKSHPVRGKSLDQTLADWQTAWPEIAFQRTGGAIVASATVEDHEAIESRAAGRPQADVKTKPKPLSQRRFDGQIKDISVKNLMTELAKSGIVFEYDAEELAKAGVNLERLIEVNARKLPAQEFFRAVFDPLGITCTIEGVTVTLSPK